MIAGATWQPSPQSSRSSQFRRPPRGSFISCRFNSNQLVLYVVELHELGMLRAVFEVEGSRLKYVATEFFPRVTFREDRMAERAGVKPTLLRIADFED